MATNEECPQRKSPRADWLAYNEGRYFVTVCTRDHRHCFGKIENGVMTMTKVGRYLDNELKNATSRHPHIEIVQYVVMPNHFHAIINIVGTRRAVSVENTTDGNVGTLRAASENNDCNDDNADTARRVPTIEERLTKGIGIHRLPLLSTFIGSLKSAVTKYAHECGIPFAWQPRYHDHAIRDWKDNNNISQYIENNVMNWEKDCFY
jgi:REP element-mobilizing transposase RayT